MVEKCDLPILEYRHAHRVLRYVVDHPLCIQNDIRDHLLMNNLTLRKTLNFLMRRLLILEWTTRDGPRRGGLTTYFHATVNGVETTYDIRSAELSSDGKKREITATRAECMRANFGNSYAEALESAERFVAEHGDEVNKNLDGLEI